MRENQSLLKPSVTECTYTWSLYYSPTYEYQISDKQIGQRTQTQERTLIQILQVREYSEIEKHLSYVKLP